MFWEGAICYAVKNNIRQHWVSVTDECACGLIKKKKMKQIFEVRPDDDDVSMFV